MFITIAYKTYKGLRLISLVMINFLFDIVLKPLYEKENSQMII
jgi:hypothetical protein